MTLNFVKQVISGFAVKFAFGQNMYFVIDLFGITEIAKSFRPWDRRLWMSAKLDVEFVRADPQSS